MAENKRRSVRQLAGRKRSVYYEPETEDDYDLNIEEDAEDRGLQRKAVSRTNASPKKKRKQKPGRTSTRSETHRRVQSRSAQSRPQPGERPQRRQRKRRFCELPVTPMKKEEEQAGFSGSSDGVLPDWTSLPIEILRDIFVFASQPIHEQTTTASINATWLIRSARTCRAFVVPALEAYYMSPSLLNNLQPHHLLELMQMPKEKTYIDYAVKVKSLEIDKKRVAYATHGKQLLDLSALVLQLPQLRHLEVLHPMDTPPYRPFHLRPWQYPEDLFGALEATGVRLKSWRWNRDTIPKSEQTDIYGFMIQTHTNKAFEYLSRLVVCGFDVNDSAEPPPSQIEGAQQPPGLASSISVLRHLKDLTFISCDVILEDFLERLPTNLERLELSNCLEVTSDMLQMYLVGGGSHLRELVLNHNAALNLAFLPSLKSLCPKLEVLKMDFTYYSERYNYNDAWAMYDQLLTENEVPTWPTSLRHLELVNLQKISTGPAQNLFRSLVDNARDLPDLRHLVIQAHINIPWRDRAGFRDQWIERLQRVYLRKNEGPNQKWGSLKQFKLWKQAQANGRALKDAPAKPAKAPYVDTDDEGDVPVRRRLSHVRVTPRKPSANIDVYSDSGSDCEPEKSRRGRPRRSARVAESQSTSAPDEDSSESEEEEVNWRSQPELFIQGLCQVVDIRIDNQRPRENQYTEANFLDSEPSGDEDWHSGAELSEDNRYAW